MTWPDESEPVLRAKLEDGYAWLQRNGTESEKGAAFYDRWLDALEVYKMKYDMDTGSPVRTPPNATQRGDPLKQEELLL